MRYFMVTILAAAALLSAGNPKEDLLRVQNELAAVEQQIADANKDLIASREQISLLQSRESALKNELGIPQDTIKSSAGSIGQAELSGIAGNLYLKNGAVVNFTNGTMLKGSHIIISADGGEKALYYWYKIEKIVLNDGRTFTQESSASAVNIPAVVPNYQNEIAAENQNKGLSYGLDKSDGKLSASYTQTLGSDSVRRIWIEKGGWLKSRNTLVGYSYMSLENDLFDFSLNGFSVSSGYTATKIFPPNYSEGKNIWGGLDLGFKSDFAFAAGSMEMEMLQYVGYDPYTYQPVYELQKSSTDLSMFSINISTPVGFRAGLGKFFASDDWRGVMAGIYWSPTFTLQKMSMEDYEGDTESNFNFASFGFLFDWGSFKSMSENMAQQAHFTISGYVIPQTDKMPFFFSLSLGMVWY